jgi:arginyl-tRNA synthetase
MLKKKHKEQFAAVVSAAFREVYSEKFKELGEIGVFERQYVLKVVEEPKDPAHGSFALPVFRFAKDLRDNPTNIASQVAAASAWADGDVSSIGGFINGRVDPRMLAGETIAEVLGLGARYGDTDIGQGQTYLVEYSSPNIAKPFGVGHLRSTILGHTLRRIYRKIGYEVVGINYPGDWGTQFGKMIVAFDRWGDEKSLQGNAVKNLLDLYVRFHAEAEKDDSLEDEARRAFKRLEDGEPEAVQLWEKFKTISYAEFNRVYGLLGIQFDLVYGESFLNDRMEPLIQRLQKAGLAAISQGALVVELGGEGRPPLLLKKADGATLYATRDLAGMVYRWEKYPGFHESLYVVNSAQSEHFKQCFQVIEMLEEAEKLPPEKRMSGRIIHVDFGWVRFAGKSMSTRRGNIVLLEDVITEATKLAGEKIREKNPDLAHIDETAQLIGVGAVIFSQLAVRRQRDVDFQWDEVLNFEGETGPYLQYTHARLCSLLRRYGKEISADVDYGRLSTNEETQVVDLLADFPDVIVSAAEQYEPYYIASYLLKLAGMFNKVYQRKDESGKIDKIISEDSQLSAARMALVRSVQLVIREGLHLLGLQAPEEM